MTKRRQWLDLGSTLTIVVTLALFVVSIFVTGLTHDLLLEVGVFLVSLKLILMSHKNGLMEAEILRRLEDLAAAIDQRREHQ